MHKHSLNFPDALAMNQNQSPTYQPSNVRDCRFFNSRSSTNKRSLLSLPNGTRSLTQQEFFDKIQRYSHQYANQLSQSRSVQSLHPYRPYSDSLVPSPSKERKLPAIKQVRYSHTPQPLKIYKKKTKKSRKKLNLNNIMSQPVISHKPGVVSFGDTQDTCNYQSFHSSSQHTLFLYRNNGSAIQKQKKKFANYLSKKPKQLKKFVKKNKQRVKMEKSLKRRLSHENIFSEKEINKSTANIDSLNADTSQQTKRADTANSTIVFVNDAERDDFLEHQNDFKEIAKLPTVTDSNSNDDKKSKLATSKLSMEVDNFKKQSGLSIKRRQSIARSVDNVTNLASNNLNSGGRDASSTDNSESLVVKLRVPDDNNEPVSMDKQLVYNVQSKAKHKTNVSEILARNTVDVETVETVETLSKLTHENLKSLEHFNDSNSKNSRIKLQSMKTDAASEGGDLTKRSLPQTGELSLDSLKGSVRVSEESVEISAPSYAKYGDTDTVYIQNIGFTHRSSHTVEGNINNDEHGLGLFLAKVKHHLSDPAQKKLLKSKSAMLLHDPRQIRSVLTKLRTCKDPNVKWKDEIQLDDQLTNWWDEVSLFKMWCHRKDWWKWIQV